MTRAILDDVHRITDDSTALYRISLLLLMVHPSASALATLVCYLNQRPPPNFMETSDNRERSMLARVIYAETVSIGEGR